MSKHWTDENASQELVNAWIHGVGFLLSIPAGFALAYLANEHRQSMVIACAVYGVSLSAMYLFSTLSHAVRDPERRHLVRSLDQGIIYTLIAGTFTPFIWGEMQGWSRIAMLVLVWFSAALGFYSKVLAKHRIDNMTALTYVLLGWGPAFVLFWSVSTVCFASMLLGGILYTVGVLFLQNDHRNWYFHPIWHVLVILASACHYLGIALFAVLQWDR
ncbi:MAG: PAQR family membrane homeostasis protein TrhA [Pirellula sp.]|jgi:hemolysin III